MQVYMIYIHDVFSIVLKGDNVSDNYIPDSCMRMIIKARLCDIMAVM